MKNKSPEAGRPYTLAMNVKNTVPNPPRNLRNLRTGAFPLVVALIVMAVFAVLAPEVTAQVETSTHALADELEAMDPAEAAQVVLAMPLNDAAAMLGHMSPSFAAAMIEHMDVAESVPMVVKMAADQAGTMLDKVSGDYLSLMVDVMDELDMLRVLPELTPLRLWGVPFEKLARRLPSVDAMHLAFWNRPEPPTDLPALQLTGQTENLSVYTLPEARPSEWAVVVDSPAPIETIWAKFRRPVSDLKILVRNLDTAPSGAPDLPGGRIANAFFSVEIGEPGSPDVEVAAAIVSVDRAWLSANDVQKWSVQLARLNEALGVWEPIPTKRIREDEERVFFAVAIPGFSTLAITGSPVLEPPPVRVGGLALDRRESLPGEPVSVTALLTNTSPGPVVYTAVLWVNSSIETARSIVLAAGETAPVRFWITRPVGSYALRLDRSTAALAVRTDAAPSGGLVGLPGAGGFAPSGGLLTGVAGAAAGLLAAGGLTVLASSRRAARRPRTSAAPRYRG